MKRLIAALAVPMVLMSTVNRAPAESVFKGTLDREYPWEIMVDNSAAAGQTALTIVYLITATKSESVLLSVSANGRQPFRDLKIPRGTRRILLEVSPPRPATIDIEVTQTTTAGNASFPHRVEQGATVVFAVVPLFDPPVAVDDTAVTDRNVSASIGVLFNDSSADGAALFVNGTTDPPHGSATIYDDGSVIYTPDAGFVGLDSFDYEACADVRCAGATVSVEVR